MSGHGFRPVFMAASVVGAALGCYLVSLNVASERAKLEDVEESIVLAQRDIRLLQTEIGTRGRLAQLERWNARFIRLSAPSADQFVEGGFQLAALVRPDKRPTVSAPVVLAAAPAAERLPRAAVTSDSEDARPPAVGDAAEMLHRASYEKPAPVAERKVAKPAAAITAKPVKSAMADPLAPLPGGPRSATGGAPASLTAKSKERSTAQ